MRHVGQECTLLMGKGEEVRREIASPYLEEKETQNLPSAQMLLLLRWQEKELSIFLLLLSFDP